MFDIEAYVARYLPLLGEDMDAFDALIEPMDGIVPCLRKAYEGARDPKQRALLLEVLWQHRDPSTIPVLAAALWDAEPAVWKEALNGLVALGCRERNEGRARPDCVQALQTARLRALEVGQGAAELRGWIEEALEQLREGFFGERREG